MWYSGSASPEFVAGLKELKSLKELSFARVAFNDQSLAALHELTGLERLQIMLFQLTAAQRQALQKALPKCQVSN